MQTKILQGPILESNEELIAVGMNSEGSLDTQFHKDLAAQYPPAISFYRRWVSKGNVAPGSFQLVPGLNAEGAQIRPSIFNLVVSSHPTAGTRFIEEALRGAWEEAAIFGFYHMALHAPSIYPTAADPAKQLAGLVDSVSWRPRNPFRVYEC